jgi:hypothetical protein
MKACSGFTQNSLIIFSESQISKEMYSFLLTPKNKKKQDEENYPELENHAELLFLQNLLRKIPRRQILVSLNLYFEFPLF